MTQSHAFQVYDTKAKRRTTQKGDIDSSRYNFDSHKRSNIQHNTNNVKEIRNLPPLLPPPHRHPPLRRHLHLPHHHRPHPLPNQQQRPVYPDTQ